MISFAILFVQMNWMRLHIFIYRYCREGIVRIDCLDKRLHKRTHAHTEWLGASVCNDCDDDKSRLRYRHHIDIILHTILMLLSGFNISINRFVSHSIALCHTKIKNTVDEKKIYNSNEKIWISIRCKSVALSIPIFFSCRLLMCISKFL